MSRRKVGRLRRGFKEGLPLRREREAVVVDGIDFERLMSILGRLNPPAVERAGRRELLLLAVALSVGCRMGADERWSEMSIGRS